jgi:hypothetical protein
MMAGKELSYWENQPKFNQPIDWQNTITITVGMYLALQKVQMEANALLELHEGADETLKIEFRERLWRANQYCKQMDTLVRSRGKLGEFSWEESEATDEH